MPTGDSPIIHLDFHSPQGNRRERCIGDFEQLIVAGDLSEVVPALKQVDAALAAGREVIGWLSYEAAPAFDPAMRTRPHDPHLPLVWFAVGGREMPRQPASGTCHFGGWTAAVAMEHYAKAFARIQNHIADGDTYQINYTFPLHSTFQGDVAALYAQLRQAQAAAYCAWIHTAEWDILSASPELFFAVQGSRIVTRPMKGTRPRGRTSAEDATLAAELAGDPKDRAENVMIVDLLRNDLGRIARMGSVRPTTLFAVEKYPTVWQMTSTVEAELPHGLPLSSLWQGLFPCGSITGAPKVKTMEIIAREEPAARGVYCGCIGYARPGEAIFNVAIRTLTIRDGQARYPVGSGLVADSKCEAEYAECLAKARVLERAGVPPFELLETLAWHPQQGYLLLERHLRRLLDSSDYFLVPARRPQLELALEEAVAGAVEARRVRLLVSTSGNPRTESAPLGRNPVRRVALARTPVDERDPFLYHKTTHREVYRQAREEMPAAADDILLFNNRGELTESTIANLALWLDGKWRTPPVCCGLLAGTMRAELVERGEWIEAIIHREQLTPASRLRLCNSVRGLFDVDYLSAH